MRHHPLNVWNEYWATVKLTQTNIKTFYFNEKFFDFTTKTKKAFAIAQIFVLKIANATRHALRNLAAI